MFVNDPFALIVDRGAGNMIDSTIGAGVGRRGTLGRLSMPSVVDLALTDFR